MEKVEKFELTHLVLYAKGWYYKTGDIWDDVKKIVELDGYSYFSKKDAYHLILTKFSKLDIVGSSLVEVVKNLGISDCWRHGYYVKEQTWIVNNDNLPEYDMETSVLYYILSTLCVMDNDRWNPQKPNYDMYPKNDNIKLKNVEEIFGE